MPLTSALKHPAAHFWGRPGLPSRRAWRLWVQLWVCLVAWAWAGTGVGAAPQQFPEASEDNHFIFRSDGTYSFSYDTGAGQHQSFRIEARDSTGSVSGRFGYVDPDGVLRITEYQADTEGYRANMETYHLVSWFPRSPLLVGPLPQPPSEPQDLPGPREAPQQTTAGPAGTPLFFPPQGPVLIIGPLPKPLQPPRNLLDQEPPDLTEEALLGASLGTVLPPPPSDFLQGPAIQDLSQSSPPEILQEGILNNLLQGSLEEILQESVADLLSSSALNTSLAISNDTLPDLPSEAPQTTVDDEGQELLESLEQRTLRADMQDSDSTSPTVTLLPNEDSTSEGSPGSNVDNSTKTVLKDSVFNTTFDVFVDVLSEHSTNISTQERQDNFNISHTSTTSTTNSTATTTSTTNSTATTTSTATSTATTSFLRVNNKATTRTQLTTPVRPQLTIATTSQSRPSTRSQLTTTASPQLTRSRRPQQTRSRRPQLTTTASPQLTRSRRPQPTRSRRPQLTRSGRPQITATVSPQLTRSRRPQLTTTASPQLKRSRKPQLSTTRTPSVTRTAVSTTSATVARPLSPAPAPEAGAPGSGQEKDRWRSDTFTMTFPPVPALTYLPVGEENYGAPPDVYSYLPQTLNPFF